MDFKTSARRKLCCGAALIAFTAASPAFAQQAGTTEPEINPDQSTAPIQQKADRDDERSSGLQDIVVTARRSSERAQDVPIAITTLTAQDLTKLSVRDIIEIQKITPGLYMNSQNSAGRVKITIRGQSEADSRLTTDGSVGIYIDGVNIARDYGLRSAFVDLAQVEVLKGPQGTLFGKNTTGGAINITTQHPKYEAEGYVDFVYGSYNNMQGLAVINLPIVADKLAVRAVGQVISRDGYGTQLNGQEVGDDRVVNGRLLIRADPTENVSILLSGDYVRQRSIGTNVILTYESLLANQNSANGALGAVAFELGLNRNSAADRLTAYNVYRTYYDPYQNGGLFQSGFASDPRGLFDDVDTWGTSGEIAVDLGAITLKSITAYRGLSRTYVQDLDGTPFILLPVYLNTKQRNFTQELQISSIDGQGLDWQVGGYYNREKGSEFSASETNAAIGNGLSSVSDTGSLNKSLAGYGQAVLHLGETVRVTGGARYTDDFRQIDSRNRRDSIFSIRPSGPGVGGVCRQLSPAIGGPVYPNCTYVTDVSYQEVTWLASADWKPTPDTLLYASVNKGYRSGGFTAQAIAGPYPTLAALQVAATPFSPESVLAYEVGFKADLLDRRLRVNGAAYYQDYTDIQQQIRDVIQGQPITLIRNAAKATLWGGELEVTVAPTETTTINLGAAYLNANYDEYIATDSSNNPIDLSGQPFPAPEWTFNIGATQIVPLSDGEVRFNANYNWVDNVAFRTDATDLRTVSQTAYGLLDARITWHIASQDLDVSVFGKNLTDKRYLNGATNLESLGYNIGFPGDPRAFGIQMRKNF